MIQFVPPPAGTIHQVIGWLTAPARHPLLHADLLRNWNPAESHWPSYHVEFVENVCGQMCFTCHPIFDRPLLWQASKGTRFELMAKSVIFFWLWRCLFVLPFEGGSGDEEVEAKNGTFGFNSTNDMTRFTCGMVANLASVLLYGSSFVSVKRIETGDGECRWFGFPNKVRSLFYMMNVTR